MINNVNIIAIDDDKVQLTAIQDAFFAGGIPCLPIHYQYDLIDNKSGIGHIDVCGFKPRIVVSDLNLRNGSLSNTIELVHPIAELLKKLDIEGPYLLIFWSGVTEQVESIMKLLQERFSEEITLPLHFSCINKDEYLSQNPTVLKNKVLELIDESALLKALLDWESRITKAAQKTINSLFSITKPLNIDNESEYHLQHGSKLESILAKIGNETIGILNANENPEVALDLGLAPVLHDQLNTISNDRNSCVWKNAAPKIGTDVSIGEDSATKLNSFYHIERVDINYPKSCRGVFLKVDENILKTATTLNKLETRFGITIKSLIEEEFLIQIVKQNQIDLVRNSTQLGFIEISAECDQAQKKTKLHRYVIAALTPLNHELPNGDTLNLYGKQNKKSHNGIYRVPDINIDGIDYMLQLSYKYQIGSIPTENSWLGEPKFRLRDQIMVDISFNCAQYISRPGIIAFK